MRKNWKKLLSLVLALAMVLNMNVAAFADEVAPVADPAIEEEAPAADPAPAAEEPAAAEEEPAEAEAPAAAEEEASAVEAPAPEAAASEEAAPAEEETEEAAEGAEVPEGTVIGEVEGNGRTATVSGITIDFEKHSSIVSDNAGNLTIKKNSIVGLSGTPDKRITVTVEDGAEVYVGAALGFTTSNTDRDEVNAITPAALTNVNFAGSGTLYFENFVSAEDAISVNEASILDMSGVIGGVIKSFVVSANEYKFYTDAADDGYDETLFTGLSGALQILKLRNSGIWRNPGEFNFAKTVSASSYTVSMNKKLSRFKDGKFLSANATQETTLSIGEGKDYDFGETIFYEAIDMVDATNDGFWYTKAEVKPGQVIIDDVIGAGAELMESSWRSDGIDLQEAVVPTIKYPDLTGKPQKFLSKNIDFTIVEKGAPAPAHDGTKWGKYTTGTHAVFDTLANGKTISPNTAYDLYARNRYNVDDGNTNANFFSDVILVGSFTTKETPTEITIPSAKTITYQGDAAGNGGEEKIFLDNFAPSFKYNEKDTELVKKLEVGTDAKLDGYTIIKDDHVGLAVKIDGQTVGELKNYIVLSSDSVSYDGVAKMNEPELKDASKATLDGLRNLKGLTLNGYTGRERDIKYLSANTYYVKSVFEAYDTDSYTGTGNKDVSNYEDLPYLTASSNVMTLTVEKAKLVVVPDYHPSSSETHSDKDGVLDSYYYAYSEDPEITTTSGNVFYASIYAYDPDKASDEGLKYQRVTDTDTNYMYFDRDYNNEHKSRIGNVFTTGKLKIDLAGKAEELGLGYPNTKELAAGSTTSANTYKLSVSEGSLEWVVGNVSDNFVVDYTHAYTITVNPVQDSPDPVVVSYNFLDLEGYAYYGSDLTAVQKRIYQRYTVSGSDVPYIYNNSKGRGWRIKWGVGNNVLGDGVWKDPELKTKISSNGDLADIEPGESVYVSVNSIDGVSANTTDLSKTQKYENLVAKVTIEPRPIDVYAHAYPYSGETYDGKMDPEELYGDVRSGSGDIYNYSDIYDPSTQRPMDRWVEYWDSKGHFYGYDDYDSNTKKEAFMGADLLANISVEAENASAVDTSETTFTWYDNTTGDKNITVEMRDGTRKTITTGSKQYVADPFKVQLKLDKGAEKAGSGLADNLKGRFFINTAIGYVDVLPQYTIAYMLQYEDPKNDNGKNADKLVAYETRKITKTEVFDGRGTQFSFNMQPSKNGEVVKWAPNGVLNAEQNDRISDWRATDKNGLYINDAGSWNGTVNIPVKGKGYENVFVNAIVTATVGSYIEVETITPVRYNGLAHIADNRVNWFDDDYDNYNLASTKSSQYPDLTVNIRDTSKDDGYGNPVDLLIGRDYTVTYKNNTNASVYFVDNGKTSMADKVMPNYTKKTKKPQVVIKGAGRYKGKFKATVYFDIYPEDIEGNRWLIEDLDTYYGGYGLYDTVNGLKDAYFAKTDKSAKVSYKVQNVHYPSKVVLYEQPDTKNYYSLVRDESKGKITTLKKNKDYAEVIERFDTSYDKNRSQVGWVPVTSKQLLPGYDYRITAKGKGNYTGDAVSKVFHVYDSKECKDLSKLKITVPGSVNWEKLMLNDDNSIRGSVDLTKLGIKVESKKKTTWKKDEKAGVHASADNWTYDIYKIDSKTKKVKRKVVGGGRLDGSGVNGIFDDAGTYKVVIRPSGSMVKESIENKEKDGTIKEGSNSVYNYYVGSVEKTFNVKGITLKKSDFKLAWNSKKWTGSSDAQTLYFSPKNRKLVDGTPVYGKNKLNKAYVDKYLSNDGNKKAYYPSWNPDKGRFEAFVRDYALLNSYDGREAADNIAKVLNSAAGCDVYGDVYYFDNGSQWSVKDQIDVYRFVFETGNKNSDVGTYRIYIPTDGIFGADGLYITYKRTGTASKVLSIENAK